MTRDEAIDYLSALKLLLRDMGVDTEKVYSAIDISLSALRPVSREQVEKVWRGEWERIIDPYGKLEGFLCKCGHQSYSGSNFCPKCGGVKTNEAVEMVIERLEELQHDR